MANNDIWTNRAFLIFIVEFEIALGLWLLSGLFKRAAYVAAVGCFSLFCCVTLYKALAGYGSCGCFGKVHVSPWITLFAIDVPAVVLLLGFVPRTSNNEGHAICRKYIHHAVHLVTIIFMTTMILVFSGTKFHNSENTAIFKGYEYDLNKYVLTTKPSVAGYKIVLFYKRDCPNCIKTIEVLKRIDDEKVAENGKLNILLVEIPPFGTGQVEYSELLTSGILANSTGKAMRPKIVFMKNDFVFEVWSTEDFEYNHARQIVSFVSG